MTTSVLFRSNGKGRLAAVVRVDGDGVFDLDHQPDGWRCSCAAPCCSHSDALRTALSSAAEAKP